MKKVAILLATFNGEKFLEEQLSSIISQENIEFQIIARDDGSTDNSVDILHKYCSKCNLKILQDSTPSGSPAANFIKILSSINPSEYDYLAFSDQDDIWFPDKIFHAIKTIEGNQSDAYSSDLIAFDYGLQRSWYVKKASAEKEFDYLFQGASAGCTYVLNQRAITTVCNVLFEGEHREFDNFSHDWLIYAICRSRGLRWEHDRVAKIAYRQHSSNSFGAMPGYFGLFKRLTLSRSGWYRKQIIFISQFIIGSEGEEKIISAVKRFNFIDRLYLATSAFKFRRRTRDAVFLSIILLFGFF